MPVAKLTRRSTRQKQRVGKPFSKTRCPIQMVLTCGKLSKVLTVHQMQTLPMKLCPTTVEPSLILNPKLMPSLTTTPGLANSICHNPTVTLTEISKSVVRSHLLMMSCAPLLMSELQSAIKKMKGKGAAGSDNIPPSFLKSLCPLALQELLSIFSSSFSLAY